MQPHRRLTNFVLLVVLLALVIVVCRLDAQSKFFLFVFTAEKSAAAANNQSNLVIEEQIYQGACLPRMCERTCYVKRASDEWRCSRKGCFCGGGGDSFGARVQGGTARVG